MMSDEPDNLLLVYLRRIDTKVDRLIDDVRDLKHRMSAQERQTAELHVGIAALATRMDRIDDRLERMKRRLDIVPA